MHYHSACRLKKLELTLVTTHAVFHFIGNNGRGRILKRRYKKAKHAKFSENEHFVLPDTHRGTKCPFFLKFGMHCFLGTSVLRFALSPYYVRFIPLLVVFPKIYLHTWNTTQEPLTWYLIILTSLESDRSIAYYGLQFLVHGFEFNVVLKKRGNTHSYKSSFIPDCFFGKLKK